MKRILAILITMLFLSGCNSNSTLEATAMELRGKLLQSAGFSFNAKITADYGDEQYVFSLYCEAKPDGSMHFTVKEPEVIAGITGTIAAQQGKLTFTDTVLSFSLMADGQLSPVAAPWIFVKSLTGGYLSSCVKEEDLLRISLQDSYEADALYLDVWLNQQNIPIYADILYANRRILTLEIENFCLL